MDDSSDGSSGQSWSQALLTGVSAVVDSQLANQFGVNTGLPNQGYGVAGQAQTNLRPALTSSPILLIGIGLAAVLVLVLVLKK